MWDPEVALAVNGLPINEWAEQQKSKLDEALHQRGFRVACMTSYTYKGVGMIHYALEREEIQMKVEGDWNVESDTNKPL